MVGQLKPSSVRNFARHLLEQTHFSQQGLREDKLLGIGFDARLKKPLFVKPPFGHSRFWSRWAASQFRLFFDQSPSPLCKFTMHPPQGRATLAAHDFFVHPDCMSPK